MSSTSNLSHDQMKEFLLSDWNFVYMPKSKTSKQSPVKVSNKNLKNILKSPNVDQVFPEINRIKFNQDKLNSLKK